MLAFMVMHNVKVKKMHLTITNNLEVKWFKTHNLTTWNNVLTMAQTIA
jgi:hypothetical protein